MNKNWDLTKLYASYESEKYKSDKLSLKENVKELNEIAASLDDASLERYLRKMEEIVCLEDKLFNYTSLQMETDVNDEKSASEYASLNMMVQDMVIADTKLMNYIKDKDVKTLCKDNAFLSQYEFLLENEKKAASHMLSEKEEVLYSKLRMVASDSWSEIQSKLTSNLSIHVEGFEENMPLSSVRGLAYDKDATVRKNAYVAELASYKNVEDAIAMGLNNIKREANIMAEMRGYKDIEEMTLESSHMSRETLNALILAIEEELPEIRKYYKIKARALGHKNGLPFYDLFAPMGDASRTYTYEEAEHEVLDVYKSFSDHLYQLGYRAFHENWIDVYPHEGKVGGAFCAALSSIGESRVLTNFTGMLSDCQTLAHELGHAYHDEVIKNNAPLNWGYPMELAETASILCQTLMSKKMISDAKTDDEKINLIENSLQEETQTVVDIYSRFLFENSLCDTPVDEPLSADAMCRFMMDAQKKSYGDGLDPEYLHPYMWACKSHYYSASYNYYNWPYAFGLLYAKGLYAKYMENKEEFVKKYDTMLVNTCIMNAEDVAKIMGIDITKKEFWITSLKTIEEDIRTLDSLIK